MADAVNPDGCLYLITGTPSSHTSRPIDAWLAAQPRVQQVFIPVGACWLNLQEAWWRQFRHAALTGQTFADGSEIDRAPPPPPHSSTPGPSPGAGTVRPNLPDSFDVS